MTDDELRAIRERAEAATPGPWYWIPAPIGEGVQGQFVSSCNGAICNFGRWTRKHGWDQAIPPVTETAAFIAHAREDIPRLLDEIASLKRQIAEIALLRGAIAAQDDRARKAGERCGVPYELHGCDWPDAMAEEVQVVRAEIASLKRQVAALMPMAPEQP